MHDILPAGPSQALHAEIADLIAKLSAAEARAITAEAKAATLEAANASLLAKDQDIATRAQRRAIDLMASVGQPAPVAADTKAATAETLKADSKLKGAARLVAAISETFTKSR